MSRRKVASLASSPWFLTGPEQDWAQSLGVAGETQGKAWDSCVWLCHSISPLSRLLHSSSLLGISSYVQNTTTSSLSSLKEKRISGTHRNSTIWCWCPTSAFIPIKASAPGKGWEGTFCCSISFQIKNRPWPNNAQGICSVVDHAQIHMSKIIPVNDVLHP